jgi:hypothetical protein
VIVDRRFLNDTFLQCGHDGLDLAVG